jgi:predicted metal-binding membrane protein
MAITWASMMAAMMLPTTLPALVSLRRVARALAFAASFLLVWIAVGVPAFVAYDHSGLMDAGTAVTVALLAAAALYELSPLKRACLRRCRANAYGGPAVARGARHGVDCIGSCAGLMLALFTIEPMSIGLMVAVSALVFVQIVPAARVARLQA